MVRKKLLALFLCLIVIFSFTLACTNSSDGSLKEESQIEQIETKTEKTEPKTEESIESQQTEPEEESEISTPVEKVEPPPKAEEPPPQTQPQETTVHITNTGKKYHRGGCRYLSKSDITVSLSNAKAKGLGP